MPLEILEHHHATRNDIADLQISIRVPDIDDMLERLVVRQVQDDVFEVCCLPWMLYDFALGDHIKVSGLTKSTPGEVVAVSRQEGRRLVRVFFAEGPPGRMQGLASSLASLGYTFEVYNDRIVAIDAVDESMAEEIMAFLRSGLTADESAYEFESAVDS